MKRLLVILLLSGCNISRLTDRIEIPPDQVWEVYKELHVIKVDSFKHYHRITAIPYGKSYPKYSYQWKDHYRTVCVGDIVPLTDSLRSRIAYKHHWKRTRTRR
ncbi:MAG: hypothetical protein JW973_08825 [Bacteroidales bacterium]|nr:hypothetical protein [Bacteroidales bacterium]